MDQSDVEMQIADMVLKVNMNNRMKWFTFSRRWILLDIHIQLQARNWMLSLWLLTQDGVHQQHFSPVHVWREFGVVDFGFLRLLVTLDEDLADAN